jgi:hypothetical protein
VWEFGPAPRAGKASTRSITPEALGSGVLAHHRHHPPDFLGRRDNGNTALNTVRDDDRNGWASFRDTSLDTYEALKLLPLGEVAPGRPTTAS